MFKQETANEICRRLALGETLRQICRDEEMPATSTVCDWVLAHPDFGEQYARARTKGLDVIAEEIIEIADTPEIGTKTKTLKDGSEETTTGDMIEHRRLRVDARKWLLSKMRPEKYGDRTAIEHSGPDGGNIGIEINGDPRQRILSRIASTAEPGPTGSGDPGS